jgi:DNA polymerase
MTLLYHPESDITFIDNPTGPDWDSGILEMDAADLYAGTRIRVALGESEVLPSFDFETYSEAGFTIDPNTGKIKGLGPQGKGGLPVVGTPVYAEHPSTEVLCLYYNLKDGRGRRPWYPGAPDPQPLIEYIRGGGRIEAWNITFEFWIWNMVCARRYGWPVLPIEQCRCAMAKSRRYSMPGKLNNAAKVLGTPLKDPAGTRLIQKLSRPHTPTKHRTEYRWTAQSAWDDYLALYRYCDQDTVVEDNASAHIPDLTPYELSTWLADQTINARGVQVDIAVLDAAIDILGQTERKYNAELATLTGNSVQAASELAKMQEWLGTVHGVRMYNMQAESITTALKDNVAMDGAPLPPEARRALEIRATLGAANVKKLRTLKLQVSSDGRLRDQYMFCGADRTGRASAGGVQLQNITAKGPKTCECESCGEIFGKDGIPGRMPSCPRCGSFMFHALPDWTIEAVEQAIGDILHRDLDRIERMWGDPIALLCGCLRGLFIAKEGNKLVCCDFSAIEAVAAACLARCQWRIDIFAGHGKIYEQSAANATGIPFEEILEYKRINGMHHPARKTIGKVRELAGGYGGWIGAWKAFGADEFMNDDEIKADVLNWRAESPEIVEMWGGQFKWCGPGKWDYRPELFGLEGAAINAILHPGQCFSHIDITYGVWDDILFCRLPSGRYLHYHRPRLIDAEDKLRRGPCYSITFEGYNSNSQKGPIGWHRLETYGGRLFENVVQAVAADIQFEAIKRCEDRGYPIVMHTHDEGTAEVPSIAAVDGHVYGPGVQRGGSVDEMVAIMAERPTWASWWPLRAAGWEHKRYQKD